MHKFLISLLFVLLVCSSCERNRGSEVKKEVGKVSEKRKDNPDLKAKYPKVDLHSAVTKPELEKSIGRKRKKKFRELSSEKSIETITRDTSLFLRIDRLRRSGIEIDLNEPRSRDYLFRGTEYIAEHPYTMVSHEKFLKVNFDNDILDNTDHFYTNGIRIDLVSQTVRNLPFRYLMVPYSRTGVNYYGIALTQNMYTASTTKMGGILYGDRPYAAYLCFSFYKITNDARKHFRQTSEISLGIIGPSSGGKFVQSKFHNAVPTNDEPLGWEYQIQDDIVLNYNITWEKGIISYPGFDLNLNSTGTLGTLYTNIAGGFSLRAGKMNSYFDRFWLSKGSVNRATGMKNFQSYFFLKAYGTAIGYDATLQGGMMNRSSVYTIGSSNVSRVKLNCSAGFTVSIGGVRLDIEQYLISPEFVKGWWHKWVHFGLTFCL